MGNTPDAIIVGSGPAGVSAARTLLDKGKSVLLLEAGDYYRPSVSDGPLSVLRRHSDEFWKDLLGPNLDALSGAAESSPKLRAPGIAALHRQYIKALRLETEDFVAAGALAVGGLSNFWGATTSAYSGPDLADYPITDAVLMPHFRMIAQRIGISGSGSDDLADYHGRVLPLDGDLPIPARISRILAKYARHRDALQNKGFKLGRARNAVITTTRDQNRNGCNLENLCLWGCSRGSIYSSAFDVDELERSVRFRLERNFLVCTIRPSEGHWVVEGERAGQTVKGRTLLLAAGTLGTTRLVLDLMGWHNQPIPLLTNPVFASVYVIPAMIGGKLAARGFAMAHLQYVLEESEKPSDYAAGMLYLADGLPAYEFVSRLPLSRPAARVLCRALMPAFVLATCYLSSDYSANQVTLTHDGLIKVRGRHSSSAAGRAAAMGKRLRTAMRALGLIHLPGNESLTTPGSDFHYAGTLPMNGQGALATTASGEFVGAPGLFIVDGACLPRLTSKSPTFTIMANAARIAQGIPAA